DQRHAGRVALRELELDTRLSQTGERRLGELVRSYGPEKAGFRPEPRRRDRLVCAFTAGIPGERRVGQRLPHPRQARRTGDQVKVDRPYDGQLRHAAPTCRPVISDGRTRPDDGIASDGLGSDGKRLEILDRATEQVLAQVEEADPKRRPVRRRADARRVVEARQSPQEDCELEVRLRDAYGRAA